MSLKTASIRSPPSRGTSSDDPDRTFPVPAELLRFLTMTAPSFGSWLSELVRGKRKFLSNGDLCSLISVKGSKSTESTTAADRSKISDLTRDFN